MAMDRQAVLDALRTRIGGSGGVLVRPVRDLAADIGIPPQRLYYLIQAFEQSGELWSRSRGPKGLELHVAEGPDAVPPAAALDPGSRPRRRRGRAPGAGESTGQAGYCPWCGHPAEATWQFCVACGNRLPQM